jgi:hypothetical protein
MRDRPARFAGRGFSFCLATDAAAFSRCLGSGQRSGEGSGRSFIEQVRRAASERRCHLPYGEKRDVLLAAFHRTRMGTADADNLGCCLLAQLCRKSYAPHVEAEYLAYVHPIDGPFRLFYCHAL